jgi:hypothetical protein
VSNILPVRRPLQTRAAMARWAKYRADAADARKGSPNRNRLIARSLVWSVVLSGAALWLPHLF